MVVQLHLAAPFVFLHDSLVVKHLKPVFQLIVRASEPTEGWLPPLKRVSKVRFLLVLPGNFMKIFFLDDDKERHRKFKMNRIGQDVTTVWTYADACAALSETVFDVAYLDHDLSERAAAGNPALGEKTGTDVAEFIASMHKDRQPAIVIVHSFNEYGRERMKTILDRAGIHCTIQPFYE